MRCFTHSPHARKSTNISSMIRAGNLLFACLLWITMFSGHADSATPVGTSVIAEDPYLILPPGSRPDAHQEEWKPRDLGEKEFTLRHIYHHGSHSYPNLHRYLDIPKDAKLTISEDGGRTKEALSGKLRAKSMSTRVERMVDRSRSTIDGLLQYAAIHGKAMPLSSSAWTMDEIPGPNYTDKTTILAFAKMAANAYVEEPFKGDWQDVKGTFNYTKDFGWKEDGLRGHIYVDEKNETIVIGMKGTSMALFDGAETTGNDKLNDNLFASCCCGEGHWTWKTVCDCQSDTYTCNSTCLVKSLNEKNHYYWAVKDLYHNITARYPKADIWMSGHSLGGVVSALLGLTFSIPVMTFEAYPDALAASRLGLPVPPGYHAGAHQSRPELGIYHFGHNADPVFMGSCNGIGASCTLTGYALESTCHTGKRCVYDTVNEKGWRVSVAYHRILSVIKDVIETYDEDHVPICVPRLDCTDCALWKFFNSNGSESSTSTSSTSTCRTRTRTETCKTPGWWGCLDESTTTTTTTTTTSSTSSLSTSSISASSSLSSSTSCETPGWFGCNDPTSTATSSTTSSTPSPAPSITNPSSAPTSVSTSCNSWGWFGCNDPTTFTPTPSSTQSQPSSSRPNPTNLPTTRRKCVRRYWYGLCREWNEGVREFKDDL